MVVREGGGEEGGGVVHVGGYMKGRGRVPVGELRFVLTQVGFILRQLRELGRRFILRKGVQGARRRLVHVRRGLGNWVYLRRRDRGRVHMRRGE